MNQIKHIIFSKLKLKIFGLLLLVSVLLISLILSSSRPHLSANENRDIDLNFSTAKTTNTPIVNLNFPVSTYSSLVSKDKRAYVLDEYFKQYNSPLVGFGKVFVAKCEQYGAPEDCLTVAAIAKHETNLCTYKYSAEMFNCWGFGGGEGYRLKFNSFEESIDRVTSVLSLEYGRKYMIDPELMEKTFCGVEDPLCEGWGDRIKSILFDMNEYSKNIGAGDLFSLRK